MTRLSKISGQVLDVITLRDLKVQCVIGVNPDEKIRTQALRLDVRLYVDTRAAAMSGLLSRSVDYSFVATQLSFILTQARFRLLESAAEALAQYLLTPPEGEAQIIEAVDIEIHKPEALGGLAIPSVRIYRERATLASLSPYSSPILFQVPEAVIDRLQIDPESELIIEESDDTALLLESSDLLIQGTAFPKGAALSYAKRMLISNPTDEAKSVLRVCFRGRERAPFREDRLH